MFNTAALLRTVTEWVYETTLKKVLVTTWQNEKIKQNRKNVKNVHQPNHSYRLDNNWVEYDVTSVRECEY